MLSEKYDHIYIASISFRQKKSNLLRTLVVYEQTGAYSTTGTNVRTQSAKAVSAMSRWLVQYNNVAARRKGSKAQIV